MTIEDRLAELGFALPPPPDPAANYVPWVQSDGLLFLAGQTPKNGNKLRFAGRVGLDLTLEEARAAAQLCALRLLSVLRSAAGEFSRIERITKVNVFVNTAPDFHDHSLVADGASDLFAQVLGAGGMHARSAIGVTSLPGNASVEVDVTARLKKGPE